MHIFLLILKVIGLTLLFLLLLVLVLLLLILYLPVTYQAAGRKEEIPPGESDQLRYLSLDAKAGAFLSALRVQFQFREKQSRLIVRLFGFTLLDTGEEKGEPPEERDTGKIDAAKERTQREQGPPEQKSAVQGKPEEKREKTLTETQASKTSTEERKTAKKKKPEESKRQTAASLQGQQESAPEKQKKERRIPNLTKIVLDFLEKVTDLPQTVYDKIEQAALALERKEETLCEKLSALLEKGRAILSFLQLQDTKKILRLAGRRLKKLLKHILPRKADGNVSFGTGDPESTGKMLGALAVIYPRLPYEVKITPDFEDERFEFDITVHGHVMLGVILWQFVALLVRRELWRTIKRGKQLFAQ